MKYNIKGGIKVSSVILWILVAIGFFVVDILSSGFCFILLAAGSIAASICAAFGMEFSVQIIVFAFVNIISIAAGYPWLKKKFKKGFKKTPLMEENYIGKVMESDKDIKDKCQIKVGGEYWTAVNTGEKIKCGDKFQITGIEGIKLLIKKVEEK